MIYLLIIFMLCCCYYTFTYGLNILKAEKNILASVGTIILSIIGFVVPTIALILLQ